MKIDFHRIYDGFSRDLFMAVKMDFHRIYGCENGFSPFKNSSENRFSQAVVKMDFHRIYGCENGFSQDLWL